MGGMLLLLTSDETTSPPSRIENHQPTQPQEGLLIRDTTARKQKKKTRKKSTDKSLLPKSQQETTIGTKRTLILIGGIVVLAIVGAIITKFLEWYWGQESDPKDKRKTTPSSPTTTNRTPNGDETPVRGGSGSILIPSSPLSSTDPIPITPTGDTTISLVSSIYDKDKYPAEEERTDDQESEEESDDFEEAAEKTVKTRLQKENVLKEKDLKSRTEQALKDLTIRSYKGHIQRLPSESNLQAVCVPAAIDSFIALLKELENYRTSQHDNGGHLGKEAHEAQNLLTAYQGTLVETLEALLAEKTPLPANQNLRVQPLLGMIEKMQATIKDTNSPLYITYDSEKVGTIKKAAIATIKKNKGIALWTDIENQQTVEKITTAITTLKKIPVNLNKVALNPIKESWNEFIEEATDEDDDEKKETIEVTPPVISSDESSENGRNVTPSPAALEPLEKSQQLDNAAIGRALDRLTAIDTVLPGLWDAVSQSLQNLQRQLLAKAAGDMKGLLDTLFENKEIPDDNGYWQGIKATGCNLQKVYQAEDLEKVDAITTMLQSQKKTFQNRIQGDPSLKIAITLMAKSKAADNPFPQFFHRLVQHILTTRIKTQLGGVTDSLFDEASLPEKRGASEKKQTNDRNQPNKHPNAGNQPQKHTKPGTFEKSWSELIKTATVLQKYLSGGQQHPRSLEQTLSLDDEQQAFTEAINNLPMQENGIEQLLKISLALLKMKEDEDNPFPEFFTSAAQETLIAMIKTYLLTFESPVEELQLSGKESQKLLMVTLKKLAMTLTILTEKAGVPLNFKEALALDEQTTTAFFMQKVQPLANQKHGIDKLLSISSALRKLQQQPDSPLAAFFGGLKAAVNQVIDQEKLVSHIKKSITTFIDTLISVRADKPQPDAVAQSWQRVIDAYAVFDEKATQSKQMSPRKYSIPQFDEKIDEERTADEEDPLCLAGKELYFNKILKTKLNKNVKVDTLVAITQILQNLNPSPYEALSYFLHNLESHVTAHLQENREELFENINTNIAQFITKLLKFSGKDPWESHWQKAINAYNLLQNLDNDQPLPDFVAKRDEPLKEENKSGGDLLGKKLKNFKKNIEKKTHLIPSISHVLRNLERDPANEPLHALLGKLKEIANGGISPEQLTKKIAKEFKSTIKLLLTDRINPKEKETLKNHWARVVKNALVFKEKKEESTTTLEEDFEEMLGEYKHKHKQSSVGNKLKLPLFGYSPKEKLIPKLTTIQKVQETIMCLDMTDNPFPAFFREIKEALNGEIPEKVLVQHIQREIEAFTHALLEKPAAVEWHWEEIVKATATLQERRKSAANAQQENLRDEETDSLTIESTAAFRTCLSSQKTALRKEMKAFKRSEAKRLTTINSTLLRLQSGGNPFPFPGFIGALQTTTAEELKKRDIPTTFKVKV